MVHTLGQIADFCSAKLVGDPDKEITGIATLKAAKDGELSFFTNPRYRSDFLKTAASAVVVSPEFSEESPVDAIVVDNPRAVYASIAKLLYPEDSPSTGVHQSAVVSNTAKISDSASISELVVVGDDVEIGARTFIGPGCVLSKSVKIGCDCTLLANVTLCHDIEIGNSTVLHPGVVIGSDGFGLAKDGERWAKVPQIGSVVIGDDVEIGANTTVDRGALEDTIIENGVKLDNQIQIAHNVRIGENTAIAACTGIAGSARIGKRCTIAGAASIVGHIEIADDVHISCMTMVTKDIREAGSYSSGTPLQNTGDWRKSAVRMKQLDEMARKIKKLEEK